MTIITIGISVSDKKHVLGMINETAERTRGNSTMPAAKISTFFMLKKTYTESL